MFMFVGVDVRHVDARRHVHQHSTLSCRNTTLGGRDGPLMQHRRTATTTRVDVQNINNGVHQCCTFRTVGGRERVLTVLNIHQLCCGGATSVLNIHQL